MNNQEFSIGKWRVMPLQDQVHDGVQYVKIEPKAMSLLLVLAKAKGSVVTRSEIFEQVWKHQIVADHVLYNLIAGLRKILEPDPHHPQVILTVPKKGYRLASQITWHNESAADLSPSQSKPLLTRYTKFLLVALLLIPIGLFWQYNRVSVPIDTASKITSQALNPSIAVLPFEVFDEQTDTRFFADGLAEEIIHQLSATPNLAVISRTSSFAFRGQNLDSQGIADKLGVKFLLEGAVRKEQNNLRISVNLINATDATQVWSKVFSVEQQDVFKLQQDISLTVVNSLVPNDASSASANLRQHPQFGDAYLYYLRGSAMAARSTPEDIKNALVEYEKAIQLQPDYALAHVAIALNTMILFQYNMIETEYAIKRTQKAIDAALGIDPFMAEAFAAQGLLYVNLRQGDKAEEAFIKALNLNPSLAIAHHNYGYLLWLQDNQKQALKHFSIALRRNPMSAISNFAVADSLYTMGQLEAAFKQYKHCVELLPDYSACQLGLANFYRITQDNENSSIYMQAAEKRLAPTNRYWVTASLVDALWRGDLDAARKQASAIENNLGGSYFVLQLKTLIHALDNEQADWIQVLHGLSQQWPKSPSVKMVLALNYYYLSDCSSAIQYYESVLNDDLRARGKFDTMAWGVSHISNLAYCYQQQGQTAQHAKMMNALNEQLNEYDISEFDVAGFRLVLAKYQKMSRPDASIETQLASVHKTNSVLAWLVDNDPAFK